MTVLITAGILVACLALLTTVGAVLRPPHRLVGRLLLAGWLAVTATVAGSGRYADELWLGLGLATPLVLGLLALRTAPVRDALTAGHAVALLAAAQIPRVVGGVFLVQLALDRLPPGFAVPAGVGDVVVGLLAPFVAYAMWRRPRRGIGIAFNALGLADLVVAIPLGVLHAPGRLQVIVTEPTTELMGELPLALILTFVVPLAIVLHVASFRLLAAREPAVSGSTPAG
ncbi:MAG: hypothetical protein GEV28_28930 [Actinophytocola sp.]|uniref:hypothetical protein n=1 Tax=Actinophytocola sp. TaxID=1872138 RepID=UPI0013279437|nr:hypothetical protein [Actinophytocola sp.]MPZ84208.1 hypothetical protein [Actinophytocola sp.]